MAGFEGIQWAGKQLRYRLTDRSYDVLAGDDKVYAVSRSIHYGLFLAFEGIRFFCRRNGPELELRFLNLDKNLDRLRRSMAFNLSAKQQGLVPGREDLEAIFLRFLREPGLRPFLEEMAELGAQGYLRPFTVDEDRSIGVTFPAQPAVRAVVCRYDRYLGEPFAGVVVPGLVRAVGVNGTGHLKLGINYLMSVKAVDRARAILPEAGAALFLDDRPYDPLESRIVTEWDSSCCLFAWTDGTVVKIPESPLILPSVTIGGITAVLRSMGVKVEERDIPYGELIERTNRDQVAAVCSVGTAGILNRASRLLLVDGEDKPLADHRAKESHELFGLLGEARARYWDIYRGEAEVPEGQVLGRFPV
jgi:branched-subunit amino acid aminotransferase/4-amino-4-deoxychorismate lyase